MNRFEDTPGLFGVTIGVSTSGDIECEVCGNKYNIGADAEEDYMDRDSIGETTFAGMVVCRCCFGTIENAVLSRMPEILAWYARILDAQQEGVNRGRKLLGEISKP